MIRLLSATWFTGWLIAASTVSAQTPRLPSGQDTLPPPQQIPPARVVPPTYVPPPMYVPPPTYIPPRPELGRRNVWELYSVNSRGQFVPRVVMAPQGYYYLSDGRPYPWSVLGTGHGTFMPYAVD